jgi:hypothetical protein
MMVLISQPMAGKTQQEIIKTRERAIRTLRESGYEIIDSLLPSRLQNGFMKRSSKVINVPLYYLAESLELMSCCDTVYFCEGWKQARGCCVEHEAAREYGLKIIYEVTEGAQ